MDTKKPKESYKSIAITPGSPGSKGDQGPAPKRPRSGRRRRKKKSSPSGGGGFGGLGWLAVLLVGGCVALYFIGTVLLLPYLFRTWLPDHLSSQWQREVSVGAAAFDPFHGRLILERGSIGSDPGSEAKGGEIFSFSRLLVDLEAASFLKGGFIAREIVFEDPVLRLARDEDATINLTRLFPSIGKGAEGAKGGLLSLISGKARIFGLGYSLNNISIRNGLLTFADRVSQKTHEVKELDLSLPAIASMSYPMEAYQPPRFSAIINGSPLEIDGVAADNGVLESRLHLKSDNIDLPAYLGYLPKGTVPKLEKGRGDCDLTLNVSFAGDSGMRLQAVGSVNMRDLEFIDEKGARAATIDRAEIVIRAEPLTGVYQVESLSVTGPKLSLVREKDGAISIPGFQAAPFANSGISVRVNTAVVAKGKVSFLDRSVSGGFKDSFDNVSLTFNLLADGDEQFVSLIGSGRSKTRATISVKGRIEPAASRFDGEFTVDGAPLAPLQPYWAELFFFGREDLAVKKGRGKFSGRLQVLGKGGKVELEQGVAVLDDLAVTSGGRGIVHAPKVMINGIDVYPDSRRIEIDSIVGDGVQLFFSRDSRGKWHDNWFGKKPVAHGEDAVKQWAVEFDRLVLKEAAVEVHLAAESKKKKSASSPLTNPPLTYEARSVFLEYASIDEEPGKGRVTGKARLPGKGSFSFAGSVSHKPSFSAGIDCTLTDLNLTSFGSSLAYWFKPEVTSGILRARGNLRLPEATFSGQAGVSKFSAAIARSRSRSKREILQWHDASAKKIEVDLSPFRVRVKTLDVDQPYFFWIGAGQEKTNFATFFTRAFLESKPGESRVGISTTRISKGILDYSEPGAPPLSFSVTSLNGVVTGLESLTSNRARFSIEGLVGAKAPLSLVGTVGLFEKRTMLSMKSRLDKLKLAPFSKNIASSLGWEVADGELAMKSEYQRKDDRVKVANSLEVKDLVLGDRLKGGRPGLPLVVALLTDKHNIIRLQMPLIGSMKDSSLTMRRSLGGKVRNLVGTSTVSPFGMVSDLFPDGKAVEQVEFPFGAAELSGRIKQDLKNLAGMLAERPGLALIVQGSADGGGDRAAMMAERTRKAVRDVGAEIRRSAALTRSNGDEDGDGRDKQSLPTRSSSLSSPPPVEDWELEELAEERSLRVARHLVEDLGVGAQRIVVREEMEIVPKNTTGRTGNRVRFILGVIPE